MMPFALARRLLLVRKADYLSFALPKFDVAAIHKLLCLAAGRVIVGAKQVNGPFDPVGLVEKVGTVVMAFHVARFFSSVYRPI
jgi:hypothetical protein